MSPKCSLLPLAIGEIMVQAATTGQLTVADRYGLMTALLNEDLEEEERAAIDRLLRAVSRGQLEISDELTANPFETWA
ncbi:MAG TPA: hypothetical protein V6D07_08465 [Trichocoleus sp.]